MGNFKQICRIKTDFKTKEHEIDLTANEFGKYCIGKITWLDGKNKEGKPNYQWISFYTTKEEISKLMIENLNSTFEIEGFLKNKNWKDDKGNWKNKVEIFLTKASPYQKDKPVEHWQEKKEESSEEDSEIPF